MTEHYATAQGSSSVQEWGSDNWHWQRKAGADEPHWLLETSLITAVTALEREEEDWHKKWMNLSGYVITDIYIVPLKQAWLPLSRSDDYLEDYIEAHSDPWHKKRKKLSTWWAGHRAALETIYQLEYLNTRWQFDTEKYCFLQASGQGWIVFSSNHCNCCCLVILIESVFTSL